MDNKKEKMTELIKELNYHTKLYDEGHPVLTDKAWDDMFFELVKIEEELGFAKKNSPTQKVNWEAVSALNKVKHNHLMLSLDKTKDIEEVKSFIGNKDFIAMTKLDGLTCSLHYINGHLVSAETRGNGEIGEDITHNAKVNSTIPLYISYRDELIIDGEIICDKNAFYPFDEKNGGDYKNPRNFASGKIRSLNPEDSEPLSFIAWDVIKGFDECSTLSAKLTELLNYGFLVTPYTIVHSIEDSIAFIQDAANKNAYPIDGVVFKFNNIKYYQSLGRTEHHFKGGLAYKFYDEEYETELLDIEWSMSRMGALSPVAIFKPIDIDGTIVSRASLHNISVMKKILGLAPWVGQKIWVSKRNMIIPQVEKAEVEEDNDLTKHYFNLPSVCPICSGNVEMRKEIDSEILYCANSQCDGKLVNKLDYFCSKKGLDIKGLSKATLEKLIDWGWLGNIREIFSLSNFRAEWIKKPGFGEKSVDKILAAIESARHTTLDKFISALGIPLIGTTAAKAISKYVKGSFGAFIAEVNFGDFSELDNFGYEMDKSLKSFDYTLAIEMIDNAIIEIEVEKAETEDVSSLEGLTFCITGKLSRKRDDIKADIEAKGGKVTGSVSSKTSYLICNDKNSNTGKSKDAKALGIPIITEEELNALG